MTEATLSGLVPDRLKVRSARIILEALEVKADIGFHEFEVGNPQRLLVTVEIWLEDHSAPDEDDPLRAWTRPLPTILRAPGIMTSSVARSKNLPQPGVTTSRKRLLMRSSIELQPSVA